MNDNAILLAAGWGEITLVAIILLAAAIFLGVITIRFFRGQTPCSCDSSPTGCPAARAASAIQRMTDESGDSGDAAQSAP